MKRSITLLAAVLVNMTACGGDESSTTTTAAAMSDTREFTHAFGTSEIPTEPQRIVTTQDQNALLPLLELGVKPIGSTGFLDPETGEGSFRRTEGFDTSGIEFVGSYLEPNVEAIAALDPDLIVGAANQDPDVVALLEGIAPTIGIDVFGRSLTEALLDFGDLVGQTDRAAELHDAYTARIDELKAAVDERHPGLTVTIVSTFEAGTFVLQDCGQAMGTVAHDLDLGRPAAQQDLDRLACQQNPTFSVELLPDHDADVVLVVDYSGDVSGDAGSETRGFLAQPIWQQLQASQNGQLHVIDGTVTVGAAWARMDAFLDVLETHLLADDLVVTGVNG